jgi:hypothetical protein
MPSAALSPQAEVIIMKRPSRSLALPWFLGFAALSAQAQQTIIVNPGDSIQNAVNQAVAGDTVVGRAGTYAPKV